MKCQKCGKNMKYIKGLKFNNYELDGWECSCEEIYFNPEQAQKVLLIINMSDSFINKLNLV